MTTKKSIRAVKPASKKSTVKSAAKSAARVAAPATPATKADTILGLLSKPNGASAAELAKATDWQAHSVRGFLSGTLKKKRGLTILVDRSSGESRYRLGKG
jgi:hypothetical protein